MRKLAVLVLGLIPGVIMGAVPAAAVAQELMTAEESWGCDSDYGASQFAPMLQKYGSASDRDDQLQGIGCTMMQDGLPVTVVAKGDGWVQGHVHPSDSDAFDQWFPDGMLYDPKSGKIFTTR